MTNTRTWKALTATAALLIAASGHGQSTATLGTNLFRLTFRATCRSLDASRGRLVTTRLTDRDIIGAAFNLSPSDRTITRNFALAYNADTDSIQAVNLASGDTVDVIHFGGGLATTDSRTTQRFALMFFPGQVDENGVETNLFGSAVITERAAGRASSSGTARANISGQVQFALPGDLVLGSGSTGTGTGNTVTTTPGSGLVMNASSIPFDSTARICTGVFATNRRLGASTATTATTSTGTTGTTTTGTNTVSAVGTGTTITTGTPTTLITPGGTSTVIVVPVATTQGTTASGFGNTVAGLGTGTSTSTTTGVGTTTPQVISTPGIITGGGTPTIGATTTVNQTGSLLGNTTTVPGTTSPSTGSFTITTPTGSLMPVTTSP